MFAFSRPAAYLYSLPPVSPSRGSSVSPRRFREARQNRRSWTVLMQARRTTEAADHFTTAPAAVGCDPRGSPLRRSGRSFRRRLSLGVVRREPVLSADARPNPTDTRYRASPSPQLDRMAGWSRTGSSQRPGVGTGQEEKTATPSEVLDQTPRDRLGPAPGREVRSVAETTASSWRSCDGSACTRLADVGYSRSRRSAKGSVTTAASTGAALAAPAPARPLRGTGCRAPRSCRAHRCRLRSGLGRDARASRPSAAARTARRSAPSTTAAGTRSPPARWYAACFVSSRKAMGGNSWRQPIGRVVSVR